MAHFSLANSVNASETLLNAIGVPGEVVVDHEMRPLQVNAFACCVGGQEYLHLGVVPERLLSIHSLFPAHPPVYDNHRLSFAQKGGNSDLKVVKCVTVLSEEN